MLEPSSSRPLRRIAVAAGILVVALLGLASSAQGARQIPVGLYNTNDQTLSAASYRYAVRFSVDQDKTLDRFIIGTRDKGASWSNEGGGCSGTGAGCYAAGNGGTIEIQITGRKADGTPDLSNVLASETMGAQALAARTRSLYGLSGNVLSQAFVPRQAGQPARLLAGVPYAAVLRNTSPAPAGNFISIESIDLKASEAGPQEGNVTDPNAPGAIAGLEPREGASWSTDNGATWTHGRQVGPYFGSASSDDGTRVPWFGIQAVGESRPSSGQPYNAYRQTCTDCTLRLRNVPRAETLTEAGGYAPVGGEVGVVTVTNVNTGQSSSTAPLGTGIETGKLAAPVPVRVGDTYTVRASGRVSIAQNDGFQAALYGTGDPAGPWPFSTDGQGTDRAEVFALPHPFYTAVASAPVAPAKPGKVKRSRKARRARKVTLRAAIAPRSRRLVRVKGRVSRDASHTRAYRRLRAARKAVARADKRAARRRAKGKVRRARSVVRRMDRARIQMRRHGNWRTVRRCEVGDGRRFVCRLRTRKGTNARNRHFRAVVYRVGRSKPVRPRIAR